MLLTHEARLENSKIVDSKEAKSNSMANVAHTGNFQKKGNGNAQNNWNKNGGGNWNNCNWNQNFTGRGGGYQGQGSGRGNWNGNFRGFASGFNTGGVNSGGFAGNFNNGSTNTGGFDKGGFGGNRKNFAQGGVVCKFALSSIILLLSVEIGLTEICSKFSNSRLCFKLGTKISLYEYI